MKKIITVIAFGFLSLSSSYASADPSSSNVYNNEIWHCVSQQLLMGQWSIVIQKNSSGLIATTSYRENVGPANKPEIHKIEIKETSITGNGFLYSGDEFQMKIYPLKKPKSNPFRDSDGVVAAKIVEVSFSQNAKLTNRPFACVPVSP